MTRLIPFIALLLITGCAAPKLKRPTLTPPMPPKRAMSTAPRILRAQAPTELWLVWNLTRWKVEWDRNPETNVIGYRVYEGSIPRLYNTVLDVGNVTRYTINAPNAGPYFAVTAYDTDGLESDLSDEVSIPPLHIQLVRTAPESAPIGAFKIESGDSLNGPWEYFANVTNAFLPVTATGNKFFRVLKQP